MSILPPEVRAGYVYDRVLRAIGDRPYDDDRLPDGIPAQGRVIFRPKTAVKQLVSNGRGVTVTREPVTCTIHQGANQPDDPDPTKGGLLIDEAGAVGGVWLVVGEWSVEYHMEDRYSNIPNEEIIVTEDRTEDNPLDVALASELTPTPTQKFVVNEQIYVDSKNYRDEALEFRNDAQEAFEKFTWPVEVSTTPPENTSVIWVNPDEPAGTASDYARRAEEMYEASKALGITVDTTVGTRVFVGGTMIHGDTGWRDVSTGLRDPWTGSFYVRRIGPVVYLKGVLLTPNGAPDNQLVTLTSGFRATFVTPSSRVPLLVHPAGEAPIYGRVLNHLVQVDHTTSPTIPRDLSGEFPTTDPWPDSLPGTPA